MPRQNSKYQNELNEANYVITYGLLPFKILTAVPKLFIIILRRFLRHKDWSNDVGSSIDPDEDGVWIYRNG